MTNDQIRYMTERFLQWRLPEDFEPDCGISFERHYNQDTPWPATREPCGTNLLDAVQAEAMIRFLVEGLEDASLEA